MSGEATRHFRWQRATALANLAILPLMMGALAGNASYEGARQIFANPLMGGALLILLTSALIHMRLGMGVIIDDYVKEGAARLAAHSANSLFAGILWLGGTLSALRIILGAA